jgi:hypothetical protein
VRLITIFYCLTVLGAFGITSALAALLRAYPLARKRDYRPLPSNSRLFWLHYSGILAAMSQYKEFSLQKYV